MDKLPSIQDGSTKLLHWMTPRCTGIAFGALEIIPSQHILSLYTNRLKSFFIGTSWRISCRNTPQSAQTTAALPSCMYDNTHIYPPLLSGLLTPSSPGFKTWHDAYGSTLSKGKLHHRYPFMYTFNPRSAFTCSARAYVICHWRLPIDVNSWRSRQPQNVSILLFFVIRLA